MLDTSLIWFLQEKDSNMAEHNEFFFGKVSLTASSSKQDKIKGDDELKTYLADDLVDTSEPLKWWWDVGCQCYPTLS